jgi:hypothetical protein
MICFEASSGHTTTQTLATAATAIGVGVAVVTLWIRLARERTAFEDGIVRQYRELVKPQLVKALLASTKLEGDELNRHLRALYLYFDLCNEQVFLRMLGRIGKRTWGLWCDGIKGNLDRPPFEEGWAALGQRLPDEFQEL